jgi:hypothetical protein
LQELRERRASEPSSSAEIVPLSAEFAAQMTLFGPPQRAPSPTPAPASPPSAPAPVATFERRDDLRQERSRLVGELHRRDGRSHREINAWVNRAVGVERVQTANIKQLERSIETLITELTRNNSRTATRYPTRREQQWARRTGHSEHLRDYFQLFS